MPIFINIAKQTLTLKNSTETIIMQYPISTAKKGAGEKNGSEQTPRGKHFIVERIGDKMPIFTVFKARVPTSEIFNESLSQQFPDRDWILSRILWLAGCEANVNLGGDVDTQSRYIYIHGTSDEKNIGTPNSHGCIRMCNNDIIDLFDRVTVGAIVIIQ